MMIEEVALSRLTMCAIYDVQDVTWCIHVKKREKNERIQDGSRDQAYTCFLIGSDVGQVGNRNNREKGGLEFQGLQHFSSSNCSEGILRCAFRKDVNSS